MEREASTGLPVMRCKIENFILDTDDYSFSQNGVARPIVERPNRIDLEINSDQIEQFDSYLAADTLKPMIDGIRSLMAGERLKE